MNRDVGVISQSGFRLNLLRCFVDGGSHAEGGVEHFGVRGWGVMAPPFIGLYYKSFL